MKKLVYAVTLSALVTGCKMTDRYWYPVSLLQVDCQEFHGELLNMKNSTGWRSWPYLIDPTDKKEVVLDDVNCVHKILEEYPKADVRNQLTEFQREYLIEGF